MKPRPLYRIIRMLLRILSLGCVLGTLGLQAWRLAHTAPSALRPLRAMPYGLPFTTTLALNLAMLGAASVMILLTFIVLMPSAPAYFLRCPDLLIPLGFLTPLGTLIMPRVAALLAQTGIDAQRRDILLTAIVLILAAFFAAWITRLALSAVYHKQANALSALRDLPRNFLRLLPLITVGWGLAQLGASLCTRLLFDISPLLTAIAGGIGAVCWNLVTSALLPTATNPKLGYLQAITTGLEISVHGLGRWLLPLLVQMALLGLVTGVYVTHPHTLPSQTQWHVNVFWTGGYESMDRWYTDISQAAGAPIVSLFQTVLILLFGIFAIGIKLIIVERMNPLRTYQHQEKPDPFADEYEDNEEAED